VRQDIIKVVFYWDQPFLVGWVSWVFLCSIGEKLFLVGLVDQPFQPASNRVAMVEKAFAWSCCVIVAHITTIPRSYRVSTKNSWKSVLLTRVNRINPNQLPLQRLIPIEHDLTLYYSAWMNRVSLILQWKSVLPEAKVSKLFHFMLWLEVISNGFRKVASKLTTK